MRDFNAISSSAFCCLRTQNTNPVSQHTPTSYVETYAALWYTESIFEGTVVLPVRSFDLIRRTASVGPPEKRGPMSAGRTKKSFLLQNLVFLVDTLKILLSPSFYHHIQNTRRCRCANLLFPYYGISFSILWIGTPESAREYY